MFSGYYIVDLSTHMFKPYDRQLFAFGIKIVISVSPILYMMVVHKATIKKQTKVEHNKKKEVAQQPQTTTETNLIT